MNLKTIACTVSMLALLGCDQPPGDAAGPGATPGFVRVLDENVLLDSIAGRRLTAGGDRDSFFVIDADGGLSGRLPRGAVSGRWDWQDGFWCRTGRIGDRELAAECHVVALSADGSQVAITGERGREESQIFDLG